MPEPTKLSLRQRVLRVSRIDGKHYYLVFGRRSRRLSSISRYLKVRDLEHQLSDLKGRQGGGKQGHGKRSRSAESDDPRRYYVRREPSERPSVDELSETLAQYDVISFDVFDTALYRSVAYPNDVFRILGERLGFDDYSRARKSAESHGRFTKDRQAGTREVTLDEIYGVMAARYGADRGWQRNEIALEVELSRANPYILAVYERLVAMGKTIIFTSDMYLPSSALEEMLARNGYHTYDRIYVSNEHGRRKGDGTLQQLILDEYGRNGTIVHVGDVYESDVRKSEAAGLPAVHVPDQRAFLRENDMGSLAGSFYSAVVNNNLGSGLWSENLHYTHGFRVGGILAVGFCEYVDDLARAKNIDKILFCGRDCDVISRVYNEFYGSTASAYIEVSRYSVTGITLDRNYEEYVGRSFFRWLADSNNSRTLEQLFNDTGFGYLVDHLEAADIERFLFPSSSNRRKLEDFFWRHKPVVEAHNEESVRAATEYFSRALGDARRVLVVDVGWSGTCAVALREFFSTRFPERGLEVFGALMCTSRSESLIDRISSGFLSSYIYSPMANMDLTRFTMPGGRHPVRATDRLHLPLEYLFTQPAATVVGYGFDESGEPVPLRGNNMPDNVAQIVDMQRGVMDFARCYLDYSDGYAGIRPISSYTAFNPLRKAIAEEAYVYDVYKDFLYDAAPVLFSEDRHSERFAQLFDLQLRDRDSTDALAVETRGRILLVSPEMIHAGAPRSLLRMSKVIRSLGFEPVVWTMKAGPFVRLFEEQGIRVHVVDPATLSASNIKAMLTDVRLAICNTVVTDAYVRALEPLVPVVWYIREAANLPDFVRTDAARLDTVRNSRNICCVSEYAASQLARFTDGPIEVVRNSVEDVAELAEPYRYRDGGRFRFVQLGTIEHRKGYDLLVAAYRALPTEYRDQAEIHFAGGFINSGTSYSSYLFGEIAKTENVYYHGLITNEKDKVALLSQMDAVVVASRDESCSLVALEGAMLAKPLIVTENVGAKYMVVPENGLVVESGSVEALRDALMSMMDRDESTVAGMGAASRRRYDQLASMDAYRGELAALISRKTAEGADASPRHRTGAAATASRVRTAERRPAAPAANGTVRSGVVVSLTSFPDRIGIIDRCVDSLLGQSLAPDEVALWLSTDQFPGRADDLPNGLRERVGDGLRIHWVPGDLGPHKKYYYAAQEYPGCAVITVDDDALYDTRLVETLYKAHVENPRAVISERANLILFRPDGELREYDGWVYDCRYLRATPTYQLLPTGVGGVLYPSGALPPATFDEAGIRRTSLRADDLWLKVMTTANGYPVVMPRDRVGYEPIQEAQAVGLWRANSFQGQNDAALRRVLAYFDEELGSSEALLRRIRGIGPQGEVRGPEELDLSPLI